MTRDEAAYLLLWIAFAAVSLLLGAVESMFR
jgi:hypothetical protein